MRVLLALVLLALTGCASAAPKDAAYRITFAGGYFCSATAVSAHTILTAEHCLGSDPDNPRRLETVGGKSAMRIGLPMLDGKDHALIRVSIPLAAWARVGPQPKQGDRVTFYGNPQGEGDWMRSGEMIGFRRDALIFQMPSWGGDSGAGIFDSRGRLVAILKGIPGYRTGPKDSDIHYFDGITAAEPLAFTVEQWAKAFAP